MIVVAFTCVREGSFVLYTDVLEDIVFADVAVHLQDLILKKPDIKEILDNLASYAAARLGRPDRELSCGITLARPKKPATTAGSNACARVLQQVEGKYGDGPGITAMRTAGTVVVPDLRGGERWPEWAQTVRRQGFLSVLSLPLSLEEDQVGVVSFYCEQPVAFSDEGIAAAEAFTEQASKGLRLALQITKLRDARDGLSAAMQTRTVIDLATGAIMAHSRCSQEAAFKVLREASNNRNMKLRDVASAVISSVAGGSKTSTYFDE
jgi:GAF domain-containing protein